MSREVNVISRLEDFNASAKKADRQFFRNRCPNHPTDPSTRPHLISIPGSLIRLVHPVRAAHSPAHWPLAVRPSRCKPNPEPRWSTLGSVLTNVHLLRAIVTSLRYSNPPLHQLAPPPQGMPQGLPPGVAQGMIPRPPQGMPMGSPQGMNYPQSGSSAPPQLGAPRPTPGAPTAYPQRPADPMTQQQGVNMLATQMTSMALAPQATTERSGSKHRHRYANDPSLAPTAADIPPPTYGNVRPTGPTPSAPTSGSAVPAPTSGPGAPAKPRIDPNQAPSVVEVHAQDQQEFAAEPFYTMTRGMVPRANTDFYGIDNGKRKLTSKPKGNANPKFMRITTGNLPAYKDLADTLQLPLALVLQPMADLRPDEVGFAMMPVPEVDFGPDGPLRCTRCKGYINPSVTFVSGGAVISATSAVPDAYFCNLDMNGRRLDLETRPELKHGSVEFVATKEFSNRPPAPASVVFALDVAWGALQNGSFAVAIQSIRNLLYGPQGGLPPAVQFGIVTFDRNVHFYNLNASLDQAQMLVMADPNDPFVPLSEGFLVDPMASRHVIEPLLDALPAMFGNNRVSEAALGAALKCAQLALASTGGRIFAFQSSMPASGVGAVKPRDNTKAFGTPNERSLFVGTEPFYEKLGEECVSTGVSVDLFVAANTYVDVATVGTVTSLTGGATFLYPGFNAQKLGFTMREDVVKAARRNFGFNGVLRLRCSDGMLIDRHLGNFFMRNSSDVELAQLDSEKTVTVLLQHEGGRLDEKLDVCFQAALLYTRPGGERRIRVHNLSIPVTTLAGNVFKFADPDCLVNVLAKQAAMHALEDSTQAARDKLTERCVAILTAYRRNCAQGTSPGQLILPENLKLLPVFANAILKSKLLRSGMDVSLDVRVQQMRAWRSMPVTQSLPLLYPRLAAIHTMTPEVGKPDAYGRIVMPTFTRLAYPFLASEGAYLLENGHVMYLWLGRRADPALLSALFGVSSLELVDPAMAELPRLDNPFSQQVVQLIAELRQLRPHGMAFHLVRQQLDPSEVEFANLLTEDKNLGGQSYIDYLCVVHRQIQYEVSRA
ncbi:COPII coat Sec23p-Sfb3p heterodimer component [Massospora cicadina]|nr:COPII coat Sec23p-Sfb3p heterodimer component [Massospora cicadina]